MKEDLRVNLEAVQKFYKPGLYDFMESLTITLLLLWLILALFSLSINSNLDD